jgi:hypothetical protein
MRWLAAGALLCALVAGALAGPAEARPRAAVAFLPFDSDPAPLLEQLAARPGMAIGLTSPTVGGFRPAQMALDMSQGARIPTRLYDDDIPPLRLVRDRLANWELVRARARDAPGDLVPGLLGQTVEDAGMRAGYAGIGRRGNLGAIVAADKGGRVALITLGSAADLPRRAIAAWNDAALLVVDLPRGAVGLRTLDGLLRARAPDDLVYVVRAPEGEKLRLLASGVAAPGVRGLLRSDTTRRDGLIAATDVAPTVLRRLGLAVPDEMQGEPIEGRGDTDPQAVADMGERLSDVSPRRGPALFSMLGLWLILLALMRRRALRLGFLAALWFPGVALLTAALAPGDAVECAALALGSFALAALTDRAIPWPVAPAVPAAIVFLAHAIDLAFGSPLIGAAISGPNPAGGARFYGVGNELEVILAVSILVGAGSAIAWIEDGRGMFTGPRHTAIGFGVVALVAAVILGSGRLGADVGGVITIGAGIAAATVLMLPGTPSRRTMLLAAVVPIAALVALAALDLVSGGNGHFTRTILQADSAGSLWDVVTRRYTLAFNVLKTGAMPFITLIAVLGAAYAVRHRRRIFAPLGESPAWRATLIGGLTASIVGALSNDSGPMLLAFGVFVLACATAYIRGDPRLAIEEERAAAGA